MILWLALTAWADPTVDVMVGRSVTVAQDLGSGPLMSAGLGVRAWTHLGLEGRIDAKLISGGGGHLQAMPALRLHLLDPETRREAWRPSLMVGGGGSLGEELNPVVLFGVDVDAPTGWPHHMRFGAATWTDLTGGWTIGLRVGLVGRPGRSRHEPMVPPSTEPPPSPTATSGKPWWDPETCTWTDEAPKEGWHPEQGISLPGGSAPRAVHQGVPSSSRRGQGWVIVAGSPAHRVVVGEQVHDIGEDGVARLRAAEGPLVVEVKGGGQRQRFEVQIMDGYALWLRASPPPEVRVLFEGGSSQVRPEDRILVQELARNRGSYRLRIAGSYSPDGGMELNLQLAAERAEAIAELLRTAGLRESDYDLVPPRPPDPSQSAAQQRAVFVQPVLPEVP
ncbi:MAG: hypothetical protein EA397_16260 [Deltaproteobacteria bacterium]|nr:MAG: hypothetical protein EA397_16260 [Deltaproteobacteria bacterium]